MTSAFHPPTADNLRESFDRGTRVLFDLPVEARCPDGSHALLNLAEAARGGRMPWFITRTLCDGQVVDLRTAGDRGLYVITTEGEALGVPRRQSEIYKAIAAAPTEAERHTEVGAQKRLEAGRLAMQIRDAHVRAEIMRLVDGWKAAAETLVDSSDDGALYDTSIVELARILVVTCPSTGREYVHCVPADMQTAAEARRWMMRLPADAPAPDCET